MSPAKYKETSFGQQSSMYMKLASYHHHLTG